MKISSRPPLLPPKVATAKLFLVGSTVGPIVDSLHNQCLLEYDIAPITIQNPLTLSSTPLFCSSWAVPPLLGTAYIVLGYILPRVIEVLTNTSGDDNIRNINKDELKRKAILAVTSTAVIIKLSELLQTHATIGLGDHQIILDAKTSLEIMAVSDAIQWVVLDGTPIALVASCITAIGGPLSELPFVANGFWHYLPQSADYLPLSGGSEGLADIIATTILGKGYKSLALSSITGPCYFAVTMDAIALGRYFYYTNKDEQ